MTREEIIQSLLGKPVHVIIDRPIGFCHKNMIYPVNYGYIPDVIAGDGAPQDVYVLGVDHPVSDFDGIVIGAIRRRDDVEDKLVVAPERKRFHQAEIAEAVAFQEQYFSTSIQSIFQKSCGVVPYRIVNGKPEFLLLFQRFSKTWSFPKGHMEPGESEAQTALRELKEESGLDATLISLSRISIEYNISPLICKQVVLFLGQVQGKTELQEQEILKHQWVKESQLEQYLPKESVQAAKELIDTFLMR